MVDHTVQSLSEPEILGDPLEDGSGFVGVTSSEGEMVRASCDAVADRVADRFDKDNELSDVEDEENVALGREIESLNDCVTAPEVDIVSVAVMYSVVVPKDSSDESDHVAEVVVSPPDGETVEVDEPSAVTLGVNVAVSVVQQCGPENPCSHTQTQSGA
jgi:hypothetical protein